MSGQAYFQEVNAGKITLDLLGAILLSMVPLLLSTSSMFTLNKMVISPLLSQTENSQPQVLRYR